MTVSFWNCIIWVMSTIVVGQSWTLHAQNAKYSELVSNFSTLKNRYDGDVPYVNNEDDELRFSTEGRLELIAEGLNSTLRYLKRCDQYIHLSDVLSFYPLNRTSNNLIVDRHYKWNIDGKRHRLSLYNFKQQGFVNAIRSAVKHDNGKETRITISVYYSPLQRVSGELAHTKIEARQLKYSHTGCYRGYSYCANSCSSCDYPGDFFSPPTSYHRAGDFEDDFVIEITLFPSLFEMSAFKSTCESNSYPSFRYTILFVLLHEFGHIEAELMRKSKFIAGSYDIAFPPPSDESLLEEYCDDFACYLWRCQ